jgi:hypothetical protein
MEFETVEMLRQRHPAWRLLRANNASLVLSFLGAHFVTGNRGATAEQSLVGVLDEHLDLDDIAHAVTIRAADQEVLHDSDHPSVLVLPVTP